MLVTVLFERIFIVIFMEGFRITKLQIWGMSAALAASVVIVLSAIIGTTWSLSNSLGEIRGDIRALTTRVDGVEEKVTRVEENMESLKEKVNSLEVEVRSTNEYLRKSENQDIPKDTSASDLTPVTS